MESGHPEIKTKILIASDDLKSAMVWAYSIRSLDVKSVTAGMTAEVEQIWAEENPNMVIIESIKRESNELDLCRSLRSQTPAPILLLSNLTGESYSLAAYEAGVDESITLPISPRLFRFKVNAWLRRLQGSLPSVSISDVKAGVFYLDTYRRILHIHDREQIKLTNLEMRLLFLLMRHPNRTFLPEALVERVWGYSGNNSSVLKNVVYRLRRKIEPEPGQPRYLITDAEMGYHLRTED